MQAVVLSERTEIVIRFNEADPLGIVWHGNYIRYFEDGREAFGKKYGIKYLDIFGHDFTAPVVHVDCNYKRSVRYGDSIIVETRFIDTPAAKLKFEYTIYNAATQEVVATGSSVQVFLDKETATLQLINPPFFAEWKQKWGII
ncbi:acyl-CoA thioester hydrolase [Chitinophaga skermanii]|uniref:Acyl-CoA thioester hydrolase n=1 Tax=Chitinophaga skermanii TaxID=331697 RepID=A0A327QFQ7_9BACT|nr:acyl-CoA thioesterase [Chitinophaga skermanii]RAJ02614.1 acyl-CoA thioester hydrolase [Chitinophaga skermanii]